MKRPAFQFYTGDWQGNSKLRRCTHAEKGIWMDVLCLMHDSDDYGVLRWPLKDIATAVGCKVSALRAIADKGVMKGADSQETATAFIFTPRHAGKDGEPVTLIPEQEGPVWYSSRMVRDEYIRSKRGESTRFDTPKATPKPPIGESLGGGQGDGPSSSSSTSKDQKHGADAPSGVWSVGIKVLTEGGMKQTSARAYIAKLLKSWDDDAVADALEESRGTAEPESYVMKLLQAKPKKRVKTDPFAGAV